VHVVGLRDQVRVAGDRYVDQEVGVAVAHRSRCSSIASAVDGPISWISSSRSRSARCSSSSDSNSAASVRAVFGPIPPIDRVTVWICWARSSTASSTRRSYSASEIWSVSQSRSACSTVPPRARRRRKVVVHVEGRGGEHDDDREPISAVGHASIERPRYVDATSRAYACLEMASRRYSSMTRRLTLPRNDRDRKVLGLGVERDSRRACSLGVSRRGGPAEHCSEQLVWRAACEVCGPSVPR